MHTHRSSIIRDSCSSSIHILANQNRKQSAILHKTLVKWWSLLNQEIILQICLEVMEVQAGRVTKKLLDPFVTY